MSNYWEQFGERSPDFWDGVKEGVRAFAIWKDEQQLVGIMRMPIKEVFREIDQAIKED